MRRLFEITALTFALLLAVPQLAWSRSVPQLSPPTVPSQPQMPATDGLQGQARRIVADCLSDANPQVRANAVEVVATTRDLLLMPTVRKLLTDEVIPVRFAAALAVGDLQYGQARDEIARLLNDPNPNIKIAASYAIARLGNPEYYKILGNAVKSQDQTVRANAALLLGKSGRQEGLPLLYETMQRSDSEDKVVLQAAESIAMLKDRKIYSKLWTRLISAYADDRVIGIRAMGALGTQEARNALVTMLDDAVPEVRLATAEQLGKLGDPTGEREVLAVLNKYPGSDADPESRARIKILTALAIGEIGTPAVTRHLPDLLRDQSQLVRLAAAKAVLRSAPQKAGS